MNIRALSDGLRKILGTDPVNDAPAPDSQSSGAARQLLKEYLAQAGSVETWGEVKPKEYEAGRAILSAEEGMQVAVVHAALAWMARDHSRVWDGPRWTRWQALRGLLNQLLARRLPFTQADLKQILLLVLSSQEPLRSGVRTPWQLPVRRILRQVEQLAAQQGLPVELRSLLEQLRPDGLSELSYADDHEFAARIDALLGKALPEDEWVSFAAGEEWASAARAELEAIDASTRAAWQALLAHSRQTDPARPTRKWLTQAEGLLTAVGEEAFKRQVLRWFAGATEAAGTTLSDQNSALLKGLVWCCSLYPDEALSRALGSLGQSCFRKIPGEGPRSEKVGNGCIYALGAMSGTEPVAQLVRLRHRVKYQAGQEAIRKALEAASQRSGLSPEDLEELTVPTYGLDQHGQLRETMGRLTAVISVTGAQQIEWVWQSAAGRSQSSVPAEVREHHAGELKALKQTVAELQKMLPAQRDRIEALFRTERSWTLPAWRERYLDHPLLAGFARRLIWHFQHGDRSSLGILLEGRLVDEADRPLDWLENATSVRLWHPIGFEPDLILRWRTWLEEHGVTQPFKQAHREVYILTDAELNTGEYSNRFAAHILKQHQLKALCDQRGWRYRLQGGFDSGCDPCASLPLPHWGLTAEFWVDPAGEEAEALSESGINLYVSTDQVRFRCPDGQPRPLIEVPALVLTEILRDVDLFIGVASVGNDPSWADSGGAAGYRDYWQSYAFGDLSASANTRREVLERLLPKLKIASRCSLAGRFLVVKGELRTYKIHLGSSNILMEPNDQYLCIVPDRASGARGDSGPLFLPFEGDRTLSLIISKAFLLAEDIRIKDPTIVSQIGRR